MYLNISIFCTDRQIRRYNVTFIDLYKALYCVWLHSILSARIAGYIGPTNSRPRHWRTAIWGPPILGPKSEHRKKGVVSIDRDHWHSTGTALDSGHGTHSGRPNLAPPSYFLLHVTRHASPPQHNLQLSAILRVSSVENDFIATYIYWKY